MSDEARITLGHGAGGRLTQRLIREVFVPALGNPLLNPLDDAAVCAEPGGQIALTTDGFVVSPLFFPGGDIGSLAVNGTVNDLAVSGARPFYLTLAAILEEGLPIADLRAVVASIAEAAQRAGVAVVAGDTKVVERGKGDGIFLVTSGVGVAHPKGPRSERPPVDGDLILVSGPVGDHGAVILSLRREIGLESGLVSDCAPVTSLVFSLLDGGIEPRFLRDPTRGGLAGVLSDLAGEDGPSPRLGVEVEEARLPVRPPVRAICEITGVDPLQLACEGRVVAAIGPAEAERALALWKAQPSGSEAAIIGCLTSAHPGRVVVKTRYGGARVLLRPTADPLPRIC
jgi:hydrogenase expression/formation protein HypE